MGPTNSWQETGSCGRTNNGTIDEAVEELHNSYKVRGEVENWQYELILNILSEARALIAPNASYDSRKCQKLVRELKNNQETLDASKRGLLNFRNEFLCWVGQESQQELGGNGAYGAKS